MHENQQEISSQEKIIPQSDLACRPQDSQSKVVYPCMDFSLTLGQFENQYGPNGKYEEADLFVTVTLRKGQIPSKYGTLRFGIQRCQLRLTLHTSSVVLKSSVKYLNDMAAVEEYTVKRVVHDGSEETSARSVKIAVGKGGLSGEAAQSRNEKASSGSTRETQGNEKLGFIRFVGSFTEPDWLFEHPHWKTLEGQLIKDKFLRLQRPARQQGGGIAAMGVAIARVNCPDYGTIHTTQDDLVIEPPKNLPTWRKLLSIPKTAILKIVIAKHFKTNGHEILLSRTDIEDEQR